VLLRPDPVLKGVDDEAGGRAAGGARAEEVAYLAQEALGALVQGLTLVPNSAQLELFCPPYNPT
jgi:hypothetical protein